MATIQDALEARKKRNQNETQSRISSALEAHKGRKQNSAKTAVSDLATRINKEIEAMKNVSTPSWGSELKNTLDATREIGVNLENLTREVESYKSYLDENTYNSLYSTLSQMNEGYDSYLKAAEVRSQFESEDSYNEWKKAEDETNALLESEDFKYYSQIGANIQNPSYNDAQGWLQIGSWRPFGDDIGNIVTFSRDNIDEIKKNLAMVNSNADISNVLGDYRYQFMTDKEVSIYNYYLGKGDKEKADEYLASLDESLNLEHSRKIVEGVDNTALEALFSFAAGIDQAASGFKNLVHMINGTEGEATTATQFAQSQMSSNNTGVWKVTNDLANTTGNMLPSILVGSVTGGLGGALTMGGSASGNAYAEMRNLGYDEWQSRGYGALVGASETILQYLIGGIGKLGGKVSGNAVSKLVAGLDNAIARTAIKVGGNMASEGLEEALQTVLEPAFKALVTGEEYEAPEWEEILYSGLLGALSAGFLEGVPTIAGEVASNRQASNLYGDKSQMLIDEALATGDGSAAKALAEKYKGRVEGGKNLRGNQINRLIEATDTSKALSATEARLTELGEKGDVRKIAEILVKQASGESLSLSEKALLRESKYAERVANELDPEKIQSGEYASSWAENIGTRHLNATSYNKRLYDLAREQAGVEQALEEGSVAKTIANAENTTEGKFKASENGKTIYTEGDVSEEVNVNKIVSTDGGKIKVELDNGETVDASTLSLSSAEEGIMYEMVARMEVTPDTANEILSTFKPTNTEKASMYFAGVPLAYQYGKIGYEAGLKNINLTEQEKRVAYNRGRLDAMTEAKDQTKATTSKKANASKVGKNGIIYENGFTYNEKNASDVQKASMAGIEVITKMSNLEVHVYESYINGDGKRVYSISGREGAAPNGYFTDGNKIYIDINAGNLGEGAMLYTMSHEVTHYIREWNAKGFKVLGDFLIEQYGKQGVPVNALLEAQKDKIKKRHNEEGKALPSEAKLNDMAYEELVADAMSEMLADPRAFEKLAKLKQKNRTVWQKLGEAIKSLLDKLKSLIGVYKKYTPDAAEAHYVRKFAPDVYKKLQDLYLKAFVEADANYEAEKTLVENGIAVNSKTESASIMSVRDVLDGEQQQKVAQTLASRFGVTVQEAKSWISAETSLASIILNPKYSQYLDYTADANEEAIKSNSDYPQGTVDFSNICKKRRDFTEVMNRVLRNFPNHVFAATDLAKIRTIMEEEGMEVACAICYVEDRRQLDSVVAQDFIDSLALYRNGSKTRPDGKAFNANQLKAFKLIEGDSYTPSIYELISLKGRNSLKTKNPSMEEAWVKFNNARGMQSVRLLLNDAEYKRQILKYTPAVVKRKNDLGGLRIYSFSDAEMFHLIDIIQVITDSATVGLSIQGYTKVNEYARAVKDTGEKLNRSLIPKGDLGYHIEDGKVVLDFDTVEGIDINHPDFFDNIDNPNIGNIVIGINATQIKAAMTSKFIDQIIPFHTGQSNEVLSEKGIATWENYKDFQSERDVRTGKKSSHQINIYTEVINAAEAEGHPITNKVEFVNKFLEVCKENNLIPRFSDFLNVDENGNFVYTEGYHKFLVDFKTFDQNTGEYLPQMPVKPIFDNEYITTLLKDYVKEQKTKDEKLAKSMPKVLDRITNEIVNPSGETKYSDRGSWDSVKSIQGLEGYSVEEVINITKNHIQNILEEYGEYAEIVEIRPYGSRAKGTAKKKSDLDIVVQYEGDIREDDMFNMLNDDDGKLYIDGIEVDINPIQAEDSGTIEEYLGRVYDYNKYDETKYSGRDSATFNGKPFWSGSVSLLDGVIEEVHSIEEAEAADYHHSMYFSQAQVEKMENGENAFFWVDNGEVQGNWRESVPKHIIDRIKEQIVSNNSDFRYSDRDTSYLEAVNRGDMETAQRMVDEAAKEAGYTVKGLHATNAEFTVFDINKTSSENFHGKGIYFTNSVRDVENNYENYEGPDPWQKIEGRAYELVYDKYGISYEDTLTSDSEIIDKLNECYDIAIDEFKKSGRRITAYLRFDNPLILEKGMQIPNNYAGYDGIVDKQVYENIGHSGMDENTIHYVVFNPNNIKSADPVTYDDNGNVIPLSERFNPKKSDIRYSDRDSSPYDGKTLYADSEVYDYSFMVSLDPMTVKTMPPLSTVKVDGRISQARTVELGLKNAASIGVEVAEDQYAIKNAYTKRDIILGKGGLQHSLDASNVSRLRTNARLSAIGGYIVQNAVPINGLTKENKQANGTYAMACLLNDGNGFVVAIVTVDEFSSKATKFDFVEITHSINGRFLAKKEDSRSSTGELELGDKSLSTTAISEISIADFLEIVNSSHQSILSNDVLEHFGESRNPDGHYAKRVLFSERSSYAPTFYSHMGKVIDDIKLEKMGTSSILNHLKNRGVKDEEIKWSGIEAFLEGKKSVTKAELQEFVAGSQLQIVEQMSGEDIDLRYDGSKRSYNLYDSNGNVIDTFTYNEFLDGYVAESDEEIYSNEIELKDALREEYGITSAPRWAQYKLDGGSNYRELVFQLPNSTYSNRAMRGHWGQDAEGVLAHARIQDFNVDGKRMLFIEELQSDWHNEGHEKGYSTKEYEEAVVVYDKLAEDYANKRKAFNHYVRSSDFRSDPDEVSKKKFDWLRRKMEEAEKRMQDAERDIDALKEKGMGDVADAPFRESYHEYVLKRLLRMAAEEGYDSIGWTTADIQSKRWSNEYAEGYRIEYDQDIPKFLRKYGKKWGATVEKIDIAEGKKLAELESDLLQMEAQADGADGAERRLLENNIAIYKERIDNLKSGVGTDVVWSMDITDSMTESVLYEGQVMYSDRVTDKKTLNFLENQEHITTYKSFVEIDGKLYSPMATKVKGDDGKYHLTKPSEIGVWQQAEEKPDSIPKFHKSGYGYYVLKKDDGGSVTAAYNPYEHSSNLVLNDQFESAYQRPNLVTVECVIPKSEMTSGYKAKYAKDSVGYLDWKSGIVAGKLRGNKRKVYLSRWLKPVRIVPNAEVASMYKDLLGSKISVPFNVVPPQLLTELEKVGVKIDYEGSPGYQYRQGKKSGDSETKLSDRDTEGMSNRTLLANALESVAQNDVEKNKLAQYKQKISLIESEQKKLSEIREKIKELSFAKGKRDTEAIKKLQFEENQTANRINTYDKQLLNLESTKALKGVVEREKKMLRKRLEQKGNEALRAQREKASETVRELMTRHQESRQKATESRNKTAMRHKIKDVVNDLNQYLLKGTKDKHVPIELQKAVAEALDAVNMDTVGAEERIARKRAEMMRAKSPEVVERLAKEIEHIQEMGGNMEAKLSRLKTAYDSIINSEDPLVANSHDEVISNTIERVMEVVGNTPLRDMSLYQLEAVHDMYRMVLHSIRTANKAFKAKKSEEISVIANRVLEEIDKLGKRKVLHTKMGDAVSTFNWNNEKPVYAFERIGSDTFTEVFNNVRAGEDTWALDMTEAREFLEGQKKNHKFDSWDFNKKYQFTSSTGKSFELSLGQIMSLYAYSKRGDQARDHLRNGGFVFDGLTEVKKKNKLGVPQTYQLKDATAYNLSDEVLADIISKLSPEQQAFADAMQDYLSTTMGDKGNEVSLELYGVKLFKEKNYFPLKSAPQYLERAREQAQGDVKIKNKGFTKETTPKAKNPIVLTSFMDVWAGHVNEMSMYHAFTLGLEDFYRVFNYKTPASETMDSEGVIPFIENAHGSAAVSYIDQLLKDLNGGARSDPRETVAKTLISRFKKTAVMGSLSVIVQQPTALVRAMALVDAKYFGLAPISRGVVRAFNRKKHKALWAEVKKYAPVAIIKEMGYFDTGMGKSSEEWLKGDKSFMDKVDDALTKLPAIADELAWISIWEAVKKETAHKNSTLNTTSEEFLKLAGERFTEVITKTQVYDSTLAKSSNMRSKSGLMNMWTSFMAEPTTTINMVMDAFRKGDKKHIARVLGATVGSIALNAALVSLVYAMRDDDEDETFKEKYLSRFTTELVDGINPITYLPFFKDVWSLMQGFDIERADMSLINDLIGTAQTALTTFSKDTSDMDEEELSEHQKAVSDALWGIVDSVTSLAGIPEKNIRRDIDGIINLFKTLGRDMDTSYGSLMDNIGEDLKSYIPIWGWLPGESKGDKLYDAIIKGDEAYVDRLKNEYKSETAYNSAIRKALRENDPRILEAAQAWYNGKTSEYSRITNEIANEGYFDISDIKAAIKSEVNDLKKDGEVDEESSKADEVEGMYEAEHFYFAIIGGDTNTADKVKEDIINTAIANGDDPEEAEKSFYSSFRTQLRNGYADGEVSRTEAMNLLVKYGDVDRDDAYWKMKEWDYYTENGSTDGYSKYSNFYEAVKTGRNLKMVVKEYTDNGVKTSTLASQITSYYKPLYIQMSKSERASLKGYLLNAYSLLGYNRSDKSKDIDKWLEN